MSQFGRVTGGRLHTSMGDLQLNNRSCTDSIDVRYNHNVYLEIELNHMSEDVIMNMLATLDPDEARFLAEVLLEAADRANDDGGTGIK